MTTSVDENNISKDKRKNMECEYSFKTITEQEFNKKLKQFWDKQEREGNLGEIGFYLGQTNHKCTIDEAAYRLKIRLNPSSEAVEEFKRKKEIGFCLTENGDFSPLIQLERYHVKSLAKIGLLTYAVIRSTDRVTGEPISTFYFVSHDKNEWNVENLVYDKLKADRVCICRHNTPFDLMYAVVCVNRIS